MRYLPDLLAVAGVALIVIGLWMVYVPAAFIAWGVACIYAGSKLA